MMRWRSGDECLMRCDRGCSTDVAAVGVVVGCASAG